MLEDARIRPAADYHAVKITGAESELFAVHEPVLRDATRRFRRGFPGPGAGGAADQRGGLHAGVAQRRQMIAEMAPLYARYDVLVTAGPVRPRGWTHGGRSISGRGNSVTTPFNVHRGTGAGAVHRLHRGRAAAVDAGGRTAVRRCDGAARGEGLRRRDALARAAAGAGCGCRSAARAAGAAGGGPRSARCGGTRSPGCARAGLTVPEDVRAALRDGAVCGGDGGRAGAAG